MLVKNVNRAVQMMAVFMHAIWARADIQSRYAPAAAPRGHSGGRLPKGFNKHNPAGTKIAIQAASHSIGLRGRIANSAF